jgi:hypothetical protein
MLIGNPVKPGSIVRGRKEPEELESERVKRAASELGSLGGKARAARMPPERRREIARRAAAKGETSRREQSDRVDASGFYGARFRITGSPASKVVRILREPAPWREHLRELGCLAGKT